ncbi:borneol dehydrogenase, mitochondrial [Quercus suber]|uniref:Secoisolariciresinol dehydrogenase n=1 Tax=Quercus suber TaxID=58331 RepID=A0AAW0LRZ4_QUESU|nr:momilactone A synthase-like [Quercus suber]POE78570.1 secoisolariciresinol dehydrogenase [Quercus suber]
MGSSSVLPPEARRLEGKVALITGGASGIGASTARLFFKNGAKVVIADLQDEMGQSLCKELDPECTTFVHCDVTKETDVENAVNCAVSTYGKLDIMYNNAGIIGVKKTSILDNTLDDFEQVIKVNMLGPFLGTKHAARVMIPARKGCIINTASICSVIGGALSHGYTSAKHGVYGLVKNTAVELGKYGIRVNCVSPYVVPTPAAWDIFEPDANGVPPTIYSNLKGKSLMPEDIADAALFLASDDSKYVSGHNLLVDGGYTVLNAGFCMYPQ